MNHSRSLKAAIHILSGDIVRGALMKNILSTPQSQVSVGKDLPAAYHFVEFVKRVIILDLISYKGNPLQLIQKLRKNYPNISLVALVEEKVRYTFFNDVEKMVNVMLVNPFSPDELLNIVNSLMRSVWPMVRKGVETGAQTSPVFQQTGPRIISVSGGKGGVGKSILTANLAAALAVSGKKVVVVDLDLSGPNIHTLFGIRRLRYGLYDFLLRDQAPIQDLLFQSSIENLKIIGNAEDYPGGTGDLHADRKSMLFNALRQLDADAIFIDLGSGTGLNVIDFVLLAEESIVVSSPEITSVLNTYGFLKGLFFRKLEKTFTESRKYELAKIIRREANIKDDGQIRQITDLEKELAIADKEAMSMVSKIKEQFNPGIVINMVDKLEEKRIGDNLAGIAKKYLGVNVRFLGSVKKDSQVPMSVVKMSPFFISHPQSSASHCLKMILSKM